MSRILLKKICNLRRWVWFIIECLHPSVPITPFKIILKRNAIFFTKKPYFPIYKYIFLGEFDSYENFKILKFSRKRLQGNKLFFKAFG